MFLYIWYYVLYWLCKKMLLLTSKVFITCFVRSRRLSACLLRYLVTYDEPLNTWVSLGDINGSGTLSLSKVFDGLLAMSKTSRILRPRNHISILKWYNCVYAGSCTGWRRARAPRKRARGENGWTYGDGVAAGCCWMRHFFVAHYFLLLLSRSPMLCSFLWTCTSSFW